MFLTDFELKDKNNRADHTDRVDAFAHSGNRVFKVNMALVPLQDVFEDANLFDPGIALGLFQRKLMCTRKFAEDFNGA